MHRGLPPIGHNKLNSWCWYWVLRIKSEHQSILFPLSDYNQKLQVSRWSVVQCFTTYTDSPITSIVNNHLLKSLASIRLIPVSREKKEREYNISILALERWAMFSRQRVRPGKLTNGTSFRFHLYKFLCQSPRRDRTHGGRNLGMA